MGPISIEKGSDLNENGSFSEEYEELFAGRRNFFPAENQEFRGKSLLPG